MLAVRMAELLGQPVIVENRSGVSGLIAAEAVAMATPELRDKLAGLGAEPQSGGGEAMSALLRREVATWTQVIRDSGITVQ